MIDIGKQTVKIDCPEYKRHISVSIQQIANKALLKCSCGQEIQLQDKNGANKKAINDVNKSLKDFANSMKKLGKR
jgi:hypothetical protein